MLAIVLAGVGDSDLDYYFQMRVQNLPQSKRVRMTYWDPGGAWGLTLARGSGLSEKPSHPTAAGKGARVILR
jgi:hypothetical protein